MISTNDMPDVLSLLASHSKATGITEAVAVLSDSGPVAYQNDFKTAAERMEGGTSFTDAMSEAALFDEKMLTIFRASQTNGELPSAFSSMQKIAKFQRKNYRDIVAIFNYPKIIAISTVIVAMVLAQMFFAKMIKRMDSSDPVISFMAWVGDKVGQYPIIYPIVGVITWLFLQKLSTSSSVANSVQNVALKLPGFSNFIVTNQLAIWCRFASIMSDSGMNIIEVKNRLSGLLNDEFKEAIELIFEDISGGKDWRYSASQKHWNDGDPRFKLPSIFLAYIAAAGNSGVWADKMNDAAETYAEEYEVEMERIKPYIGHLSLVIIALPIGFLVFKMFSSLYSGGY